jgi:hypothetical protein
MTQQQQQQQYEHEVETLRQQRDCLMNESKQRSGGAQQAMTLEMAEKIVDDHIRRLHEYNEIKDIGQLIFGKCAELVLSLSSFKSQEAVIHDTTNKLYFPMKFKSFNSSNKTKNTIFSNREGKL